MQTINTPSAPVAALQKLIDQHHHNDDKNRLLKTFLVQAIKLKLELPPQSQETEIFAHPKWTILQGNFDFLKLCAAHVTFDVELIPFRQAILEFVAASASSTQTQDSLSPRGIEESAQYFKDFRGVKCPLNFVKTKLELAKMQSGEILEIWIDHGAPIENVPRSVVMEGHRIHMKTRLDGYWSVVIEKGSLSL